MSVSEIERDSKPGPRAATRWWRGGSLRSTLGLRSPGMLAVEWDGCEARFVLARKAGEALRIVDAGRRSLPGEVEDGENPDADIGAWLGEILKSRKAGRVEALVGVSRSSVELLHLELPPARDEELPELVHHQALRESHVVTEDAIVDFVPLGSDDGQRKVTAAVLVPDDLRRIQAICAQAALTPKRIVLRPYATTSFVLRTLGRQEGARLVVNRFGEETDLAVVEGDRTVYWRTVRLPQGADENSAADTILAEIRRTLMVVRPEEEAAAVDEVVVLGSDAQHRPLAGEIERQLSLTVTVVDPFSAVEPAQGRDVEHPGRYAGLLGMLLDEADGRAPAIDFLNPREKPKPPSRHRLVAIVAALVLAVITSLGYTTWDEFSRLKAEEHQLRQRDKVLKESLKKASKQQELVDALRAWQQGDVPLLDELRDLSLRLPNARDMYVDHMSKSLSRGGQCVINLRGLVRDPLVISRMERNLHDDYHQVRSPRGRERLEEEAYTWRFDSFITIGKRDKNNYLLFVPKKKNEPVESRPAATQASASARPRPRPNPSVR